ncbi:RraA family protein [Gulosibacter sediminis]|uniref:RraA family protein n=1 Tax=Gulosibacter sediminis TaxID=1729695 RepID=UPI0024AD8C57|nr:methyltransferase [Gulosibacter sediminis]
MLAAPEQLLADRRIADRLALVASSQIGDAQDRLNVLDGAIRPIWKGGGFVGRAVTVLTAGGDNKVIHEVIPELQPGDVLVVAGQGATHRALIGELIAERLQRKGCVGFVTDGAVRDCTDIEQLGFPVYAQGISPAGPYRNGPGRVNVPVAVGGVAITPGDWVIADDDGVVVIPQAEVESVLAAAEAKREKEAGQMRDIRAGLVD